MKKSIRSIFLAFVFLTVLISGCAPAPSVGVDVSNGTYSIQVTEAQRLTEWHGSVPKNPDYIFIAVNFKTNDPELNWEKLVDNIARCGVLRDGTGDIYEVILAEANTEKGIILSSESQCIYIIPNAAKDIKIYFADYPSIPLGF